MPPAVAAHGRAVAVVAVRIGRALNQAGFNLNLRLLWAAGLVHDMARGGPDHARRGAEILEALDMPRMAEIVATHMDLAWDETRPIREAEVLFLADKLVQEDRLVGLAQRFGRRLEPGGADAASGAAARRRYDTAWNIAGGIKAAIGRTLEESLSIG